MSVDVDRLWNVLTSSGVLVVVLLLILDVSTVLHIILILVDLILSPEDAPAECSRMVALTSFATMVSACFVVSSHWVDTLWLTCMRSSLLS